MRGSAALEHSTAGCPGAARPSPGSGVEPNLVYQHLRLRTTRRRPIGGAATAGAGGNTRVRALRTAGKIGVEGEKMRCLDFETGVTITSVEKDMTMEIPILKWEVCKGSSLPG